MNVFVINTTDAVHPVNWAVFFWLASEIPFQKLFNKEFWSLIYVIRLQPSGSSIISSIRRKHFLSASSYCPFLYSSSFMSSDTNFSLTKFDTSRPPCPSKTPKRQTPSGISVHVMCASSCELRQPYMLVTPHLHNSDSPFYDSFAVLGDPWSEPILFLYFNSSVQDDIIVFCLFILTLT